MLKQQIALSFINDVDFPYDNTIESYLDTTFKVEWENFKNNYPILSLLPSVTNLTVAELKSSQKSINGRVKDPVDLLNLYLLDIELDEVSAEFINICEALPFVKFAEHLPSIVTKEFSPTHNKHAYINSSDPLYQEQFYFHDDYRGTYLDSAWKEPGADSHNRRLFVISDSYNDSHPDLSTANIKSILGNPYTKRDYKGSKILSLTSSRKDNVGLIGACYNLRKTLFVSYFDSRRTFNLIDALELVIYNGFQGDVLLMPEVLVEQNGFKNIPLEANPIYRSALRRATAKGLVVVVAAGDENFNLDSYQDSNGKYIFDMNKRSDFEPTGTIMVGNASPQDFGTALVKSKWSNYGSRITMHSVGTEAITAEADWQSPSGPYQRNTGTYISCAIIAGTLRAIQSGFEYKTGYSLTGEQLSFLTGSFAGQYVSKLGYKPNAGKFLRDIPNEAVDVFLRDYVTDYGDRHEYHKVSGSPDIVVRQKAYAQPNIEIGEGSINRNATNLSQPVGSNRYHYVYLRAQNRSIRNSGIVEISIYYSPPSTLAIPARWKPLNIVQDDWYFPNIAPGRKLTVSPVGKWDTSGIKPGHYCFIASISHALDGPDSPYSEVYDAASFANFIRKYNNWAWRNFNVVPNVPISGSGREYAFVEGDIISFPGEKMSLRLESNLSDEAMLLIRVPLSFQEMMNISGTLDPEDSNFVLIEVNTQETQIELVNEKVIPELTSFELRYYIPRSQRENCYTVSFVQTFMGMELGRLTYLIASENTDYPDYERFRF